MSMTSSGRGALLNTVGKWVSRGGDTVRGLLQVLVGAASPSLTWGAAVVKARLGEAGSGDYQWRVNDNFSGTAAAPDDNSKKSFAVRMGPAQDDFGIFVAPATGGSGAPSYIQVFQASTGYVAARQSVRWTQNVSKNANYTAVNGDLFILVDASGAARTITLPDATTNPGMHIIVIKTDASANAVTLQRAGSDVIGFVGAASINTTAQDGKLWVVSAGTTRWLRLA